MGSAREKGGGALREEDGALVPPLWTVLEFFKKETPGFLELSEIIFIFCGKIGGRIAVSIDFKQFCTLYIYEYIIKIMQNIYIFRYFKIKYNLKFNRTRYMIRP